MKWYIYLLIILFVIAGIRVRIKKRGFFWLDKKGNKLTWQQFKSRYKEGYTSILPFQQTRIVLWSFVPILAGIVWGITVTVMGEVYWMTLILSGSLPITLINIVSTLQKYKAQIKVHKTMEELDNEFTRKNRKTRKSKRKNKRTL